MSILSCRRLLLVIGSALLLHEFLLPVVDATRVLRSRASLRRLQDYSQLCCIDCSNLEGDAVVECYAVCQRICLPQESCSLFGDLVYEKYCEGFCTRRLGTADLSPISSCQPQCAMRARERCAGDCGDVYPDCTATTEECIAVTIPMCSPDTPQPPVTPAPTPAPEPVITTTTTPVPVDPNIFGPPAYDPNIPYGPPSSVSTVAPGTFFLVPTPAPGTFYTGSAQQGQSGGDAGSFYQQSLVPVNNVQGQRSASVGRQIVPQYGVL